VRECPRLVGDEVEAGDVVARVDAPDLGEAKAALRRAAALVAHREKMWAFQQELLEGKAASRREVLAAEADLVEARIEREALRRRLRAIGVAEAALAGVESGADLGSTIEIVAPFAGVVVARRAALGEVAEAGHALLVVADGARMLVAIDLLEGDWPLVEADARMTFAPAGLEGEVLRGRLISRGAALDPQTRTVRALAEVKNVRGGRRILAPGMFGRVEIALDDGAAEALVVPREAVQWEGCHHVVFVEVRAGLYQTRAVELGLETGGLREVRSGLVAGERVVTTGAYLLKTEILKGSIGAGCCD